MHRRSRLILMVLAFISCGKEEPEGYRACNNMLGCYSNETAEYCTFGYKWGTGNPFPNAGANKPGPSLGHIEITYTFLDVGHAFSTHSQDNLTSKSFNDLPGCSKDTLRRAMSRWEAMAAVTFIETNDPASNIRFIMGDITQGGVAFPLSLTNLVRN